MKKHNLFLMCGIAGSGKSSWLQKNVSNAAIISRDEIRFSIIGDFDDYFAKENEVFTIFIQKIQEAIDNNDGPTEIYCDATHLTKKSRNKVLNALKKYKEYTYGKIIIKKTLSIKRDENGRISEYY